MAEIRFLPAPVQDKFRKPARKAADLPIMTLASSVLFFLALRGVACGEDFVRVSGRDFVHADGSKFAVRGISLGNWLVPEGYMFKFTQARSPREINAVFVKLLGAEGAARFWARFRDKYITQADIQFIAAAGFNTVRVPLHYGLFMKDAEPVAFEGPGWALIDRLIGWCRAAGLHVILDLHAAPGGQTGVNHDDGTGFPMVFYVPRYRRETVALWHEIARRYADEPAVLGYDLLNEPISPYNDEDFLNPRLEPLYREIVAAIREVDQRHAVLLEGGQWSSNFSLFGAPFDGNVAYTYHEFWADTRRNSIQQFVDFSYRYDVPVLLGESGELTDRWNAKFRALHETFGIGWCFWTYKEPESTSTVVSVKLPPGWDAVASVGSGGAVVPPRATAEATVQAFLEALPLAAGTVNDGYLTSLGLAAPTIGEGGKGAGATAGFR